MRMLFVSAQLAGHLDWGGYLPTAAVLGQRGHEVLWASGAGVRSLVESACVPFQPLWETGWRWPPPPPLQRAPEQDEATWQQIRALRALDQWLDPARVGPAVKELLELARGFQPDLVVAEMFVAAAGIVAELLGKPFAVAGWPAITFANGAGGALVSLARARLAELLAACQAGGSYFTADGPPALRSPHLHLTYWSQSWYGNLSLQPQTRHVGGLPFPEAGADPSLPDPDLRPWVLITLGTTFNRDPNFFLAAATAAHELGCLPLVVLGRPTGDEQPEPWLNRLPDACAVRDHVDFGAVLPHLAAAIHHGGAGTTHALVRAGIPQIVVPHAADQIHQAHGVVRSGAGIHLPPREVTPSRLVASLAAILPDLSSYRARAQALQAEFVALGGPPAAARLLEAVVHQEIE